MFTDFSFEAIGVPRNPEIPANSNPSSFDMGICSRADHPLPDSAQFCGMFKTPTLRNVAIRKVFFHNGVFKSLHQVLEFYNTRDTQPALWYPTVNGVVQKFNDLPAPYQTNIDPQGPLDGRPAGSQPPMSEQDLVDLEAFLDTLTDADVVNQIPAPPAAVPALGASGSAWRALMLLLLTGGLTSVIWWRARRQPNWS
jgi:cytochrome c peroxidase